MTIEIGRLVIQGQFGEQPEELSGQEDLQNMIMRMREGILQDVSDLLEEHSKRARDR